MTRPESLKRLSSGLVLAIIAGCAAFPLDHASAASKADAAQAGHPDFTGVWSHSRIPGEGEYIDGKDMRDLSFMKPWVLAEVRRREAASAAGNPIPNAGVLCQPAGMPNIMQSGHDVQIIETPKEVIFLAESDHQVVHVFMNAEHPSNLLPSWYGHSIGHWEGDTLVIDTVGLNDKSLIDSTGTPHSEALHITERMRFEKDGKRIEMIFTLDDPLAFYRPWVFMRHYDPDSSEGPAVAEYACAENNDHYNH